MPKLTSENRYSMTLNVPRDREVARAWIDKMPLGWRLYVMRPQRSGDQNNIMWDALTDISRQLRWHGQFWPPEDWKDYFMHSLKREARWMPHEEGGFIPVGTSTSSLDVPTFSDLLTLIIAFADRHGVTLSKLGRDDDAE